MTTQTRKESRLFLRSKETVAGTENTYDFFEPSSCIMTSPIVIGLNEQDRGKLGSGEHGFNAKTQAVYSNFLIKCSRLSEVAFLLSYVLGETDDMLTIDGINGVYSHALTHFGVASRSLPTYSMLYRDGEETHLLTHCLIHEFSITFNNGGSGIVEALFHGIGNMHYSNNGILTKKTSAVGWNSGELTDTISSEPLLNYRGCNFYLGTSLATTPLVHSSFDYSSENLTGAENITSLINTISITGKNTNIVTDMLRAGGDGIINDRERRDYSFGVEFSIRKDDTLPTTEFSQKLLSTDNCALEIAWVGKTISGSNRYGFHVLLPCVHFTSATEDNESPISGVIGAQVMADSTGTALSCYVQNKVNKIFNGTLTDTTTYMTGLISWWKAENNPNDTQNINDGIWVGNETYADGYVNRCFSLDGSSYLTVTDNSTIDFTSGFSVECWFRRTSTYGSYDPIIHKKEVYALEYSGSAMYLWLYINGAWKGVATGNLSNNTWYHVAATYDGSFLRMYLNGGLVGSPVAATGDIGTSNNDLEIGHYYTTAGGVNEPLRFFIGQIDELSLWSRALSADEVSEIYSNGSAGK